MKIQEVETITELCEWLYKNMPSSRVTMDSAGDIVIHTGLTLAMGGYLKPKEGGDE